MRKLIFLLFLLTALQAEIVEVAHFHEMGHYVKSDTLLLVDIDDTLILPAQMLGSDSWFESRIQSLKRAGHHPSHAVKRTITEWIAIRHITKMKIVEEGTDHIVSQWQAQGVPLMALTSQGLATATFTKHHLKGAGFDLKKTAPFSSSHFLELNEQGILYTEGIMFAGGISKGTTLSRFFEHFHYLPKRIVFIDDKLSSLLEVEQFAKERGIEYVGLRYAYADKHKAGYRQEIADIQLTHSSLEQLLSDEEAEQKLKL